MVPKFPLCLKKIGCGTSTFNMILHNLRTKREPKHVQDLQNLNWRVTFSKVSNFYYHDNLLIVYVSHDIRVQPLNKYGVEITTIENITM